ncbi:restriction endonuclease subunit S [Clostridium sp. M62/1]|uniref:restriction endonuclease subunit S n=1 Tax=Clostridium sp. M62/1 TaxID=411486 RepID=UPI0001973AE1|nr:MULTISPECIES: restriction endonuclease subunit S [Eubacteriales]EFE12701.1 type I restriction modification DNA specificity domain protein [Clostridium sp. M62/1]UEB79359.1 restriction endonuclease subunit S [Clostridium sp. M62/1]
MLSSVFAKNTQKNTDGRITNVICNSAKQGLIPQREYFDKNIANSDNTNGYYIIEENDFVYNPRKSADAPYGPISSYKYTEAGIVSPLYLCFRAKKEINPAFFEWYFRSSAWHRYVYMSGDSGARHDRVSIKDDTFFAMPINIPSAHEQAQIAIFLERIEQRIEMQRALVDSLKKYKRGVVAAIFSHQLKFSDATGNPYPEWTSCTLQDAVDFLDGQRKPLESADRAKRQGQYPYYGASGIIDYIDDFIFDEPLLLLGEDGANILNRSTPLCFIAEGKYWVNNHAHVMRPKAGQNIKFLCELLESLDYTRYNTGTAQPKLNQDKCRRIGLALPVYEEQCHIADFLSAFDQRTDKAQSILDYLLSNRDGLLQQLFI